jgi:hypothetical protein
MERLFHILSSFTVNTEAGFLKKDVGSRSPLQGPHLRTPNSEFNTGFTPAFVI